MTAGTNRIGGPQRAALIATGLLSWGAGGAASFLGSNGAGAAALIVVGVICGLLGVMGRWPDRISMSGNEVIWDRVDEAVNSQIQAAAENSDSEAGESVLAELSNLRDRLAELQRTGTVPRHPAQAYDDEVVAAVRRLLPGAEIIPQAVRDRGLPDFTVRCHGGTVLMETKWRADPSRPFGGTTLPLLTGNLPGDARLLVLTNTSVPPLPKAIEALRESMGDRGRIVRWMDASDDGALADALRSLLPDQ